MILPRLSFAEIALQPGLEDWRVLSSVMVATFRADGYATATAFAHQVGCLADEADHHPDLEVRYPGRVRVDLTTHASGGITELDVALARQISTLAAASSVVSETTMPQTVEVVIDALHPEEIRPFWAAAVGYLDEPHTEEEGWVLVDPQRTNPTIRFGQMDAARPQRSRTHLDVIVPREAAEERLAGMLSSGGRLVAGEDRSALWVVVDPEGNEVCLRTAEPG